MEISIPFRNFFVSIKIDRRNDLMVETLQHYTREDVNERNNGYNKKRQKTANTKSVISNPFLLHDYCGALHLPALYWRHRLGSSNNITSISSLPALKHCGKSALTLSKIARYRRYWSSQR